jgi:dimethylhistidine N-methyltransferase
MPGGVALEHRLTLYHEASKRSGSSFAEEIREGLSASPKRIAAWCLYDELGSVLFEAITLLPEYYLTRIETEILERHAEEIVALLEAPLEMIELGSGSGRKTRILIEAALRRQARLHYKPIDISPDALIASASSLLRAYDGLSVTAFAGDYRSALRSERLSLPRHALVLFLGSSIGNHEAREAVSLLRAVRESLSGGDALLLGADLRKSPSRIELAYDDPIGLTGCFNRNVLARINRELGGHFELDAFRYVVRYDERRACLDSFQESLREQRVRIDALGIEVAFAAGERIHTESSYKYDRAELERIAHESGFALERSWTDERGYYSLNLLRPAPIHGPI